MRATVLVCLAMSGCAGPTVYTPPVQTALQVPADRTVLWTPLTSHETPPVIMHGRYGSFPMTPGFSQDRVRAVDRELRALFAAANVGVEDERDLGGRPPAPGMYLLRLDVAAYRDDVSFAFADVIGCAMAGGLTLGLGALPCTTTRNSATQTVEVEARLYAAAGAHAASVPMNGHLESSIDVTDRRPIWHQTFSVQLAVGYSLFGTSDAAFAEEQDARLAQLIFARLAPIVARGMTAPVPPDAYAPPPPVPAAVAVAPPSTVPPAPLPLP